MKSPYQKLAGLAHDIRSPLAGVVMNVRRLISGGDRLERADVHESLLSIERTITGLLGLLEYVLERERLSTEVLRPHREWVLLRALVGEVMHGIKPMAELKHITLCNEVQEGDRVYIDRMMFFRLIGNLIGNAIKFSNEGGGVFVRYRQDQEIQVQDTGRGMTLDPVADFWAHEPAPGNGQEGFGLGLAICKRIAQAHGGGLDFQSTPQDGTIVSVRIGVPTCHVVIISACDATRVLLKDCLANIQAQTSLATYRDYRSASEAIQFLHSEFPHVILIDASKGWSEAIALVHQIREHALGFGASIMLLAPVTKAESEELARGEAGYAGVDAFVSLPASDESIRTWLHKWVSVSIK